MGARILRMFWPLVFVFNAVLTPPVFASQEAAAAKVAEQVGTGSSSYGVARPPSSSPFVRTELFFGTNRPDGQAPVSDDEFRWFLDTEITPRFPDGLTLLTGLGQFRIANGDIVQERSLVLVLLYPADSQKAGSRKIERIRKAYKEYFHQESVLRVDDPLFVWTSF